jgi:hypothetical protein
VAAFAPHMQRGFNSLTRALSLLAAQTVNVQSNLNYASQQILYARRKRK